MTSLPVRSSRSKGNIIWSWGTLGLLGAGVAVQTLLTPRMWGWGLILGAFVCGGVTRQMRFRRTPLDWSPGLLALMGGVALWVSAFPDITQEQVFRLWACILGYYGLVFWSTERTRVTILAGGSALLGVLLALLTPFVISEPQASKLFFLPAGLYRVFPKLLADLVHPNVMASTLLLLFAIPLAWALSASATPEKMPRWQILMGWFCAALMGCALVFTQSRGGYIAAAVGLLVVLWLTYHRKLAVALLVIFVVVGIGLLLSSGQPAVPESLETTLDPNTMVFRLNVWQIALYVMQDFPFTGIGMGTFNEVTPLLYPFYETQNPGTHNVYLQVGVDLGFPGLIAYLSMWGLLLWNVYGSIRRNAPEYDSRLYALTAGGASGVLVLLLHGLVDNTMWNTRVAFLPWLVMAWLAALVMLPEKNGRNNEIT